MISDILIFLTIVLFFFIGIRRGAARTLLNLAAAVISSVLSHWISSAIAEGIYNTFIRQAVLNNLQSAISQQGEQFAAQHSVQALPDGMRNLLGGFSGLFGVTPEQLQGRLVPSTQQTAQLAQTIEEPLHGLCVMLITVLISIVLFFIFLLLFKLLIRFVLGLFELPVIRQLNKILGAVFGLAEGFLLVLIAINIVHVVLSYANPAVLENTTVIGGVFKALTVFK